MKTLTLAVAASLFFVTSARADDAPPAPTAGQPEPNVEQPHEPQVIIEMQQPPPPEPEAPKPPPKPRAPVFIKADGGYNIRTLEKLPIHGADIGLGLGAQPTRHIAIGAMARLELGSTEAGLSVKGGRFACEMQFIFDRFHILLEPGFFILGLSRITFDQTIVAGGFDLGLGARFDVVRDDMYSLFLRIGGDAGPTFGDGSLYAGATFGAGVDFDFVRGDRAKLP